MTSIMLTECKVGRVGSNGQERIENTIRCIFQKVEVTLVRVTGKGGGSVSFIGQKVRRGHDEMEEVKRGYKG